MTPVVDSQPHSNLVSTRVWDPVLYDLPEQCDATPEQCVAAQHPIGAVFASGFEVLLHSNLEKTTVSSLNCF